MVSQEQIQEAVKLLQKTANPRRIILFGSYSRGSPDEGSDLDLLVVEDGQPDAFGEMVRLSRVLSPLRLPVELIVVRTADFDYWSDTPGNVLYQARTQGQVLYEAA